VADRPNMLIFMTDHQRAEAAPPWKWAQTPNLDAFAKEAVTFTDAACPSPHCCPSRASFFSGLYPSEHGVWNNVNVGNATSRGLSAGVRLWSEDVREAGYNLYFSGKWHVSAEEGPQDRGFENVYHRGRYTGIPRADEGRRPDLTDWRMYRAPLCREGDLRGEGEILREGYPKYRMYGVNEHPFDDEEVTAAAVAHIREALPGQEKPWCFFVSTLGPHDPYSVPQRFLDLYDPETIELPDNFDDPMDDKPALYRRTRDVFAQLPREEQRKAVWHYLAFCSYEDWLFGRLVDALKETGLYEDTLIVYTSDHGDYVGAHGLWAKGLPCFREAYHIPVLIRMPGGGVTGTVEDPINLTDFAPTLEELAGCPKRTDFSGVSLLGYLGSGERPAPREYVFTQSNGNELYGIQRSVATKKWKYVFNGFDYDELYDLENDPGELKNLASDPAYRPVLRDLMVVLWRFLKDHKDTCVNPYIMTALMPYGPGILEEPL